MIDAVLIANLVASCVMTGVIWFVQHVHYPLLAQVEIGQAVAVAEEHQRRTGHVVALPMAVEGLTTLALLAQQPVGVTWYLPWIGAILLAIALGCTVFLSVPLHAKMATNPDPQVGAKLVATNWPRTIAWSLRAAVCVVMVSQMVNGL
jgi:uncharacterized membrane protein